MTGAHGTALRSIGCGTASCGPDTVLLRRLARAVSYFVVLMMPVNTNLPTTDVCERFHQETMAMFVEQVVAKNATNAGLRGGSFDNSVLERVLSTDCGG